MEQKAWEFAQSTVKQVGMYAFMMYMSGGSVHIFSIMMTFTGLYQPLMAIFNSGKAFEREVPLALPLETYFTKGLGPKQSHRETH